MSDKYEPRATYTTAELLALWRECLAAISRYQSYSVALPGGGTQTKTFADIAEVRETIRDLQNQLDAENAAGDASSRPVNYARMTRRI